ncbi:site-specific recombinase DNA invertase Pin [Clostridium sp. CAG:411]|jgi:hypothetical protein|nr:hypothetical protein [Lachnospiraceae bacterium]CDE42202.1 site-specific recombinase DNA invertase Pin [Clostridium sp. CAG:411]
MERIREKFENNEILDEFDRQVFDIIEKKVYFGRYDENGNIDLYKLTFQVKVMLIICHWITILR